MHLLLVILSTFYIAKVSSSSSIHSFQEVINNGTFECLMLWEHSLAAGQPLFDGSNYTLLKLVYRLRLQTIALKHTHKNERMPSRQAQQQRLCMYGLFAKITLMLLLARCKMCETPTSHESPLLFNKTGTLSHCLKIQIFLNQMVSTGIQALQWDIFEPFSNTVFQSVKNSSRKNSAQKEGCLVFRLAWDHR